MDTTFRRVSDRQLTDEQILEFLWSAEDRLTRAIVDEFVGRGERMIWRLTDVCREERSWIKAGSAFWAPVHSTFILGAFEDSRALMGLLASLRWSAKYGVDWVLERLPSILGRIGRPAILPLKARISDRETGDLDRMTELHALAGIAAHHPIHQGEVLDFVRSIADESDEEEQIRSTAAFVLLRFIRPGDRNSIAAAAIRQEWSDRPPLFDAQDIERAYGRGEQQLADYLEGSLEFYAPGAIEARQRRWDEEAEDSAWAGGVGQAAAWVEEQRHRFLTKYEFSLIDLDDESRGDALWVAESMTEYLVRYEGMAPWRWNGATAFSYLMDFFSRRVAIDDPGRIQVVPDQLLRFIGFCSAAGHITPSDRAEVEKCVDLEREDFLAAALDPGRRQSARVRIEQMLALGIDPRDPAALPPAEVAVAGEGRKTSRRYRRK